MIKKQKGNFIYFISEQLEQTELVHHCFSSRLGGTSKGCFFSMNLSPSRNDSRESVIQNYQIACDAIGTDYHHAVMSQKQVHSVSIRRVGESDWGKGLLRPSDLEGIDGMITDTPHTLLITFHADCTPLFFLDPVKKAIGLSHAGWRGTVNGIANKTIEAMKQEFGTNPKELLAAIGPSIGGCCFQVEEPVRQEFLQKLPFSEKWIHNDQEEGKYKIDLKQINRHLLLESGLKESSIDISDYCTKCNPDLFFSHRAMGEERGNMAAMMELK